MREIDQVIDGLQRISLLGHLRDKVFDARKALQPRCGNCKLWMTRDCPREHNVRGMSRGPSCDATPCSKFAIKDWAIEHQQNRIGEAVAFAKEHDLPVPEYLQSMIKASAEPEQ